MGLDMLLMVLAARIPTTKGVRSMIDVDNCIELEGKVIKASDRYLAYINTNMLFNVELSAIGYDSPRYAAAKLARGMQAMGFRGRVTFFGEYGREWTWYLGEPAVDLTTYLNMEIDSEATVNA
jgi:hypothetical protein